MSALGETKLPKSGLENPPDTASLPLGHLAVAEPSSPGASVVSFARALSPGSCGSQ